MICYCKWIYIYIYIKGSIFLKNRHFILQERLNKLIYGINTITVELRWLEPLWDHENLFETAVVRALEGYY